MIAPSEFQRYLQSILDVSREGIQSEVRDRYIPTLAELPLQVQTCASSKADSQEQQKERREQFAVLEGLRKYAPEHVLLVGKPGSGKSTSLRRLLWEESRCCMEAIEQGKSEIPPIPILIELRSLSGSVLAAIQEKLGWWLDLDEKPLKALLRDRRLLPLLDGLNELPNEKAWLAVDQFRQVCADLKVPLIITTRELGSSLVQGIAKKLEMLPLSEPQMREFVQKRLPETGGELWRQIQGRLRELAETPLLLKLLCDVFEQNGGIPENRGDLFRKEFARRYEEFKPERHRNVTGDSRRFARDLLSYLAFKMVQGEPHTDPCKPSASWITISKSQAEKILATFLAGDRTPDVEAMAKAKEWLEDLLEWHLLQVASDRDRIEFHHQLFQEYYAAEQLLLKLAELSDEELKYNYLNYLKWTEVIALMLSLIDEQDFGQSGKKQAVRVVKLALEADSKFPAVDLMLGARLAGEVKLKFQDKTVSMIAGQEVPEWFKIFLLGETKSPKAADELMKTLEHPNPAIRSKSVWATRQLGSEASKPIIFGAAIKDSDPHVRKTAIRVIGEVIEQLDSEQVIPLVTQILTKEPIASVREAAVMSVLIKLDSEAAVLELFRAKEDTNHNVRTSAIDRLGQINSITILSASLKGVKDIDPSIRNNAANYLGRLSAKMDIDHDFDLSNLSSDVYDEYFVAFCLAKREMEKDKTITGNQDKERENIINFWLESLDSEEDIQKGNAIYNLAGWLDKEEAIPIVKNALADPHEYVRGQGIRSLARLIGKEAIPELIKALDDRHYDVREKAAETLTSLGQNFPDSLEIPEETVSKLIQILNEEQNTYIHSVTIRTLTNLCSIQQSLVLREDLESAFLNASNASVLNESYALDIFLRSSAASGLRKFKSERVSSRLVQMVGDSDFSVALSATESLKNMPPLISAKYLPALIELNLNSAEGLEGIALGAIFAIQSSCGFYNYDIAQLTPPQITKNERCREKDLLHSKLDMITQEFKKVSEEPKRIIHTQSYFEKGTHTHTHHYANDEALKQHIPEVRQLVHQLQQTHQPTTEVQAAEIIDVEFREIQKTNPTRWQTIRKQLQLLKRQILNPESHLKATKATLAEISKHYLEDSLMAKATITYLDTLSAETDQGE
jgi:HEAT repeat protein